LDNGLHVILHQDNSTPIIVTSVLLMGPQEVAFDTTLIELNPAIDPQIFK